MTAALVKRNSAKLARRLPQVLQEKLAEKVRSHSRITRTLASEIDTEFAITEAYGVTIEQLQRYLRRLHSGPLSLAQTAGEKQNAGTKSEERMQPRRKRQAEIATLLQQLFGNLAELEPRLWSHRAFLMLMGLAFEKLSTNEHELSTDELVKLTKALGDACRVQPHTKSTGANAEATPKDANALPQNFAEIVRRVYGTNFNDSAEKKS